MNTAELSLSYKPDDEWCGRLTAAVKAGAFAGQGSAWFDPNHLKDKFVAALRAYPLSASEPPKIESGFLSKENPHVLEQCHLRIIVRPYNSRGTLLVQVDLATECHETPDADQQQSVTARFLTEYPALEKFHIQIPTGFERGGCVSCSVRHGQRATIRPGT